MQSFLEYVTSDHCALLCSLLAKERVKLGAKKKLGKESEELIKSLMPSRNQWVRLRKSTRRKGLSKEAQKILVIKKTIAADRKTYDSGDPQSPAYLEALDKFTSELSAIASGEVPATFSAGDFAILPKFKEDEGGNAIYRPLCAYNNLYTKTLISAASSYFTQHFDKHLHEDILSYRPRRLYKGTMTITSGHDAVKGIQDYIKRHPGQDIYVAECDIQKFFDIINHDVVLDCFDRMAEEADLPEYHQARGILKAYLDSYGFVPNVLNRNSDPSYWHMARRNHKGEVKGKCMFKWVKEEEFLKAYTEEEFAEVRDRLGVPQGGALSCVISNIVLNDVDRVITSTKDDDRFFVRYGDDIILMHTDKEKCEGLLERYKQSLIDHKLIYHKFEDFSSMKVKEKNTKKFWKGKSKPVFLWGPGEGNASEWIGFVGYEINRNGGTRLRLSTLDKKFGTINKNYHKCLESRTQDSSKLVERARRHMEELPKTLEDFTELRLSPDPWLSKPLYHQLKSLDRYRYNKLAKLDSKLSARCGHQVDLTEYFKKNEQFSFYKSCIIEN